MGVGRGGEFNQCRSWAKILGGWGGGGPNLAERAKSRGYGKFLKFSLLKLLKMHQILKTRQLTYITPVQGCLTIKNLG